MAGVSDTDFRQMKKFMCESCYTCTDEWLMACMTWVKENNRSVSLYKSLIVRERRPSIVSVLVLILVIILPLGQFERLETRNKHTMERRQFGGNGKHLPTPKFGESTRCKTSWEVWTSGEELGQLSIIFDKNRAFNNLCI